MLCAYFLISTCHFRLSAVLNSQNGTITHVFGYFIMARHQRHINRAKHAFTGMDDQILSLYAKRISTRDIVAAFPDAKVQLCIVHILRGAMKFVTWKNYKAVAADLKLIYKSITEQEASLELDRFSDRWDDKYPQISKSWRIAPHVRN